jgi:short-subunit dehydrogenase
MKLLEGKYALVTGGGRGIGRAVALEFAKNGAHVAITALEKNELDQTQKEIENYGVKCFSIPSDLTIVENVIECAEKYFKNFNKCDILVNNAGMTHYSTIIDFPLEKAQKLFNLNFIASYVMTKQILPKMIEYGGGKIIMTSSVQGNVYFSGYKVAYSASKAAITAMAKCLQAEVGQNNIQVSVILPGAVQTKLIKDMEELGQTILKADPPEAISPIYLFLASSLAGRRYNGKVLNQQLLFELLPEIQKEIGKEDYNIKELLELMKGKLSKQIYDLFRKNIELIDFLLKYKR